MIWKKQPIANQLATLNSKFADLGLFSASTESDFFTEVINQIKTYANGTYVFSASWQYTSVYIITANKVSNTRIIGIAVPQMQNGRDMVGFSYEGTTLNLYPLALKSKITTFSNGSLSVGSGYSGQISNSAIYYVKRTDGVCVVFGQFDVSSDISAAARTPIFEGLPISSAPYPTRTVWVFIVNNATNKSYRVAFDQQNGSLDEYYTAIPSGNYQLTTFTYLI